MSHHADRVLWMPGGVRTEIQLRGAQSGGALTVLLDHPPEGWALGPHVHHRESETIHVIAGHFEMDVAGERRMLSPGETLFIPAGTPHAGRLLGGVGQRLVAFTPGGIDRFFDEVGSSQPGIVTDRRRLLEAATGFGWEFLPEGAPAP